MPDDSLLPPHSDPTLKSPRRTFIARLAGMLAAWPIVGRRPARSSENYLAADRPEDSKPRIDAAQSAAQSATLAALGSAVLPSEPGPEATARAVADFQRWMNDYRPGAEANHGYGTARINQLPSDPRPRWREQIAALDTEARRIGGRSFASLSRVQRQSLVRAALADERGESLPNPLLARHVALALVAHFYESPGANDLCYEATIGRQQCRPLSAQRQPPAPLARRPR